MSGERRGQEGKRRNWFSASIKLLRVLCLECAPVEFASGCVKSAILLWLRCWTRRKILKRPRLSARRTKSGLKTFVGFWCDVGSVLDLGDECGDVVLATVN